MIKAKNRLAKKKKNPTIAYRNALPQKNNRIRPAINKNLQRAAKHAGKGIPPMETDSPHASNCHRLSEG